MPQESLAFGNVWIAPYLWFDTVMEVIVIDGKEISLEAVEAAALRLLTLVEGQCITVRQIAERILTDDQLSAEMLDRANDIAASVVREIKRKMDEEYLPREVLPACAGGYIFDPIR